MASDATRPLNPRDREVDDETRGLLWPGAAHAWECSNCGLVYSSPAKHAEYNQQCADAARLF